tara:strand:+ start:4869 stop:5129 length:261 start_codon:yes stop_codon:yes gene_type:complete
MRYSNVYNYPSILDSFFAPTRVVVVTQESLDQARREEYEKQLSVIDNRIDELAKTRLQVEAELKALSPAKAGKDLDALDGVNDNVE